MFVQERTVGSLEGFPLLEVEIRISFTVSGLALSDLGAYFFHIYQA